MKLRHALLAAAVYSPVFFSQLSHADPAPTAALPAVTLQTRNGRATIFRQTGTGAPQMVPSSAYCDSIIGWGSPGQTIRWQTWVDGFIASGVKVFHLEMGRYKGAYGQSSFWTDDGVYADSPSDEPSTIEDRAQYILKKVPDASFIIRFGAYAPTAWIKKNPGEMQTDENGKIYEPSLASEKFLHDNREFYHRVVRYCENRPWASHILGYMVLPYGEGIPPLVIFGHFYDHSPVMETAWRGYLQKKYGTDAALKSAWNSPAITLATAQIPTDESLRAKIAGLDHFPSGNAMRPERDYALLQRELFQRWMDSLLGAIHESVSRPVLLGIDSMKQGLLGGWQIDEAFNGSRMGTDSFSMPLGGGSISVGPILDELPGLTNLITPADYTARSMGMGFDAEGIGDSMVLRGKGIMVENDARTFNHPENLDGTPVLGTLMDIPEVHAGLLRNTGMALSRGFLTYWTDIGGGYYNNDKIQQQIRIDRMVQQRGSKQPNSQTQNAIAMIVDDSSPLYENFTTGFQTLAVLHQRIDSLETCGLPYRVYLLSDLEKPNFPKFHCYIFPNLFKVDANTISLLKNKVMRDGNVVIFGPGTGITDGENVSATWAERLLGIPMKLHPESSARRIRIITGSSPALKAADMPRFFGDSYNYGPILTPDSARLPGSGAVELGEAITTWHVNDPGLEMKEFGQGARNNGKGGARGDGDYAVVFSAAVPIPGPLVRSLAHYGGCNVWVDGDAVVMASDSVVSVHSISPGPLTIHLPHTAKRIIDAATGKVVATNARDIHLTINPPETKIFFTQ